MKTPTLSKNINIKNKIFIHIDHTNQLIHQLLLVSHYPKPMSGYMIPVPHQI